MGEFWQAIVGATFVYIVGSVVRAIWASRIGYENSKKESFDQVLATDNLQSLGEYFSKKFGRVPISSYVRSSNTRDSVNKILARLSEYVDPPAEETASSVSEQTVTKRAPKSTAEPRISLKALFEPAEDGPLALRLAIQSVMNGDEWSGLARVRRDLEMQIQRRVPTASRLPTYRLVQMLEPPQVVHARFREFSKIANAAVHGSDVEPVTALQALEGARVVYDWLSTLPEVNQVVSDVGSIRD